MFAFWRDVSDNLICKLNLELKTKIFLTPWIQLICHFQKFRLVLTINQIEDFYLQHRPNPQMLDIPPSCLYLCICMHAHIYHLGKKLVSFLYQSFSNYSNYSIIFIVPEFGNDNCWELWTSWLLHNYHKTTFMEYSLCDKHCFQSSLMSYKW